MLIDNSPPAVSADTHDHGGLERKRNDASRVHTPITSSASIASDSCSPGGPTDMSSALAHRRK